MKILILGASGMLGSALFRFLNKQKKMDIYGTLRKQEYIQYFEEQLSRKLIINSDANDYNQISEVLFRINPDVIINCIGVIKQVNEALDPTKTININALLPQKLKIDASKLGARLIHISTDCVFSGSKGNYTENDIPDADDLYGKTKFLGEVNDKHCLTLRTSLIGHELQTRNSFLEWFLSQNQMCNGYTHAIFSGFPTVVFANLISEVIIPMQELHGIYHVATQPISKYELLGLIAEKYDKKIEIKPNSDLVIDRSLCADRFEQITGYKAPEWPKMIEVMHSNL